MKLLLGSTLAALLWASAPTERACNLVEDPPVSCPFCGGGIEMHEYVLSKVATTQVEATLRMLLAVRG